jgi:hypothetical protein
MRDVSTALSDLESTEDRTAPIEERILERAVTVRKNGFEAPLLARISGRRFREMCDRLHATLNDDGHGIFVRIHTAAGEINVWPSDLVATNAIALEIDHSKVQARSFGSLLVGVRYKLLEDAEKQLKAGAYSAACELLNAYGQVKS